MEEFVDLVGESPAMNAVREKLRHLEGQGPGRRLPAILIQGETGTGKGLVARLVHRLGPRRSGPFVDINCPAIPETLLEAELFGYERGAFTDARHAKAGLFQTAHRGTLFLDEVGLLSASVQAKLLTVLEDRAVRRLGGTKSETVDACIISATNLDLSAALRTGRFREDLYHRLSVIRLDLPPLRDRGDDVIVLAERFLARACLEYERPMKRLSEEARARLLAYHWPGNIRELANMMERVSLLSDSLEITGAMVEPVSSERPSRPGPAPGASDGTVTPEDAMRRYLQIVLQESAGNISRAASRLGIARNTLYARLEKYGVRGPHLPQSSPRRMSRTEPAVPPAPTSAETQWERRGITMLRATLPEPEGLDSWSETSRALEVVIAKVLAFGGRVEELSPTDVVASFGVDEVEDASRRAAHSAMVIHKGAERASDGESSTSSVRIGIHVAQVLVGRSKIRIDIAADAKRAQWSVLDKLLLLIEAGQTVASAGAAPFLERRFELLPIDTGRDSSDQPYLLTGQERRGLGLWGAMTAFVGRHDEIEVLRGRLGAAERGHGQFVTAVGEPGVGKSRLFWEFTRPHHVDGWLVLEACAVPYGKTTPYLPVIELLKAYFHIDERDDSPTIQEKVTGKVLSLDRVLESSLSALLALLDVSADDEAWGQLDPSQRRGRTLDAVRQLLLRESQVQPLLLLFEDLQWIDAETQTILDCLIERLPSARLLLLASFRPEYRHHWDDETSHWQLRVDPLPAGNAKDLLGSLLGLDARLDQLKRTLVERTGGNALFLEESVRDLVETKALIGERGAYRLAHDATAIQVPATVEAILRARIDRLALGDKRLLEAASVIGKDVSFQLLHAIAALRGEDLRRGLTRLQAAEFLYEKNISPDPAYTFKHALTQEVTYDGLVQERRRELHAGIVGAIEAIHRDRLGEQIERLAHHAFCGGLWEKALHYGRQMGERGAERRAYCEAMTGYEQALDALGHLPVSADTRVLAIDLRRSLALILTMHGEHQKSLDLLREAEALAGQLDDSTRMGRVLGVMSYVRRELGDLDGAMAAGQQALTIAAGLRDPVQKADASYRLAQAMNTMGDFNRAAELLRENVEALSLDGPGRSRGLAIDSRAWLARVTSSLGEFAEGYRHGQEAVRLAMEEGRGSSPITAHGCLGILCVAKGDWEAAVRLLESGLALCRAAADRNWSQAITGALAEAYGRVGRVPESLALLEEALSAAVQSRALTLQCSHARQLSAVNLLGGRPDEAWRHGCQALDLARRLKARGHEATALFQLGAVHAQAYSPDVLQAALRYREALALAEPRGMRPLIAHCHLGLGKLYRRTGEGEQTELHLRIAATLYRDMDMGFWLEQVQAEAREPVGVKVVVDGR